MMIRKTIRRPWMPKPKTQEDKKTDPFYLTKEWKKLSQRIRRERPTCEYCNPVVTPATLTDHVLPRRLFPELAMEEGNLKASCAKCHNKKRVIERAVKTRQQAKELLKDYL